MNDDQDLQLASEDHEEIAALIPQEVTMGPLKTILISPLGYLSLQRKKDFDLCFCPFASKNMTIRCGTWCPHLHEPWQAEDFAHITLTCGAGVTLTANVLEDQREDEEKETQPKTTISVC